MSNAILSWNNYAKSATLSALSSATNLPATNVSADSGSPSTAWQSVYGVVSSAGGAVLTCIPTVAGQSWDVIGIFRTNLTGSAVLTFSLYNTAGPTLVWSTTASPISGYGQVIALPPAGTVADYCQIGFNDSGNPDGFINVPLLFCGAAWRPLGSLSYSSTVGRDATVSEATSRGGQEYPSLFYQRRRWNLVLDALRASETWANCDALSMSAASGGNVLMIPDVTSSYVQQEALFGRLKPSSDISYPYLAADRRKWNATITERL